jgi:hypothetical protein
MHKPIQCNVLFAGALMLCFPTAFGQSPRTADNAASAEKLADRSKVRANAAPSPKLSSSSWDVWYNLVIAPGEVFILDSKLDFSQSDTVRVTVRSANSDMPSLRLSAFWTVPEAQMFGNSEVVTGDHFFYTNSGGAVFNVYGTQFRLELANTGSSAMTLTQVTIFAHVY